MAYSHALLVTGSRTWRNQELMKDAFNTIWVEWTKTSQITRPVLISGHCPDGADAMAEQLWSAVGFDVIAMPADWKTYRAAAGPRRNKEMVARLLQLAQTGTMVSAAAFLDLCTKKGCPRHHDEQLLPLTSGHFSHGTIDARKRALDAGVPVLDIAAASLPSIPR